MVRIKVPTIRKNIYNSYLLSKKSQEAWMEYRKTHCDALYQLSSGGTIAGTEYNGCYLDLTKKRTH